MGMMLSSASPLLPNRPSNSGAPFQHPTERVVPKGPKHHVVAAWFDVPEFRDVDRRMASTGRAHQEVQKLGVEPAFVEVDVVSRRRKSSMFELRVREPKIGRILPDAVLREQPLALVPKVRVPPPDLPKCTSPCHTRILGAGGMGFRITPA